MFLVGDDMKTNIRGVSVNYIQYGEGKDILLLHGWGQNIQMMKFLGDYFSDRFRITILDFPGFGESEEPSKPWTITDYVLLIEDLVKQLKIKKPIVLNILLTILLKNWFCLVVLVFGCRRSCHYLQEF